MKSRIWISFCSIFLIYYLNLLINDSYLVNYMIVEKDDELFDHTNKQSTKFLLCLRFVKIKQEDRFLYELKKDNRSIELLLNDIKILRSLFNYLNISINTENLELLNYVNLPKQLIDFVSKGFIPIFNDADSLIKLFKKKKKLTEKDHKLSNLVNKNVPASLFLSYAIESIRFNLNLTENELKLKLNSSYIFYQSVCFKTDREEFKSWKPLNGMMGYYQHNYLYMYLIGRIPIYSDYVFMKGNHLNYFYNLHIKKQRIYNEKYLTNPNCLKNEEKLTTEKIDCINKCAHLINKTFGFYDHSSKYEFNLNQIIDYDNDNQRRKAEKREARNRRIAKERENELNKNKSNTNQIKNQTINQINKNNQINQTNKINQTDKINQTNQINQTRKTDKMIKNITETKIITNLTNKSIEKNYLIEFVGNQEYLNYHKYDQFKKCINNCPTKFCSYETYESLQKKYNEEKSIKNTKIDIRSTVYLAYYLIDDFWFQLIGLLILFSGASLTSIVTSFFIYSSQKININNRHRYVQLIYYHRYFKLIHRRSKLIFIFFGILFVTIKSILMYTNFQFKSNYPNRTTYIDYSTELPSLIICFPVQLLIFDDLEMELKLNNEILLNNTFENLVQKTNFDKQKLIKTIKLVYGNRIKSSNEFRWQIDDSKIYFKNGRNEDSKYDYLSRCFRMELEYSNRLRYELLNPIHYLEIEFNTMYWNLFAIDKDQSFITNLNEIKYGFAIKKTIIKYSSKNRKIKCTKSIENKIITINRCINQKFIDQFKSLSMYSLIDKSEFNNLLIYNSSLDKLSTNRTLFETNSSLDKLSTNRTLFETNSSLDFFDYLSLNNFNMDNLSAGYESSNRNEILFNNLKFDTNKANYRLIEKECLNQSNHLIDCQQIKYEESFKLTSTYKYRNVRVNLNHENHNEIELKHSKIKLFIDILNLIGILFGVNAIGLLIIIIRLKFKRFKLFVFLICSIGFLGHNFYIFHDIIKEKFVPSLYFKQLDNYNLPNILVCIDLKNYKIDEHHKLTIKYLNNLTSDLNLENIFKEIKYFNKTHYNFIKLFNNWSFDSSNLSTSNQNNLSSSNQNLKWSFDQMFNWSLFDRTNLTNNDNQDFNHRNLKNELSVDTLYFLNFKCFEFKFHSKFNEEDLLMLPYKYFLEIEFQKEFIGKFRLIHFLYRHKNSNQFSDMMEYEFEKSDSINGGRYINFYSIYEINLELIEIDKEDKFESLKNPLSLLYGKVNLNDTTSYLNGIRDKFKKLTNLTTREIIIESDNFNLEINEDLFKQYYLQKQNKTDHQYPTSINLKQNYYDCQTKKLYYDYPLIRFNILSKIKKIEITNSENYTKLLLNLLNTLSLWLDICILDLYKYFISLSKLIIKFYYFLIGLDIKLRILLNN